MPRFGAISVGSGLPWWMPVLMSVVIFAGGSQFMAVGVVAAGGSPAAAVLAGLVLNARHLPFGLAIGDVLGKSSLARIVGSHLLIDESTAFAMAQKDPARARAAYWACGVSLFFSWNAGVLTRCAGRAGDRRPDDVRAGRGVPGGPARAHVARAEGRGDAQRGTGRCRDSARRPRRSCPPVLPVLLALAGLFVFRTKKEEPCPSPQS